MRILFLAPQPFFQERGTPIAVRMALEVLRKRQGVEVDLLVYHEGIDIGLENVNIHRIWMPAWVRGVGAGLTWKKLLCDISFFFHALFLCFRSRLSNRKYDVVHAVEESAFIALLIKVLFRTPYLYDMDSSLSLQIVEKVPSLRIFRGLFSFLERSVIRQSLSVVPVCDALAVIALKAGATEAEVLHDFSLLNSGEAELPNIQLRQEASLPGDAKIALYVGNLEQYQGIDLLLNAWKIGGDALQGWFLVLIGGSELHRDKYGNKLRDENIQRAIFLGTRSTTLLGSYLQQANILVSPRIEGNNTPMKLYSYLHAGIVTLATDLPTHTQILTSEIAHLAKPEPVPFHRALCELVQNAELRRGLGDAAKARAQKQYTFEKFSETLNQIYDRLERKLVK